MGKRGGGKAGSLKTCSRVHLYVLLLLTRRCANRLPCSDSVFSKRLRSSTTSGLECVELAALLLHGGDSAPSSPVRGGGEPPSSVCRWRGEPPSEPPRASFSSSRISASWAVEGGGDNRGGWGKTKM